MLCPPAVSPASTMNEPKSNAEWGPGFVRWTGSMFLGFAIAPIAVLLWNVELSPRVSLMFLATWGVSFVVRTVYVGKLTYGKKVYPLWHPASLWIFAVFLGGAGFLYVYCLIGIGSLLTTYDPVFP